MTIRVARNFWSVATAFATAFLAGTNQCQAAEADRPKTVSRAPGIVANPSSNESLRHEIQHAIDRGLAWLTANQNSNGWWQTPDHPAVTALAVACFNGDPLDRYRGKEPASLKRAYAFILNQARPDGSIYVSNLPTYNTALSMMAMLSANNPQYDPIVLKARGFLVGVQRDFGDPGKLDTPFDGGFGYGLPTDKVSDMSNTLLALEAIYHSKRLNTDPALAGAKDLNWEAAIHFLQSCQNLPSHNKEPWASNDARDKGGFIYHSGRSNAGGETNAATGRIALRSYGSISYAGLMSYIYADLKAGDPRVIAVREWLKTNYTLDENPGMGKAGLFYYYHTMTKAMTASGMGSLESSNSKQAHWRHDLALKLMQLQQRDGSWVNENVRWWEKEPALVTAYSLLTLEMLWRGLAD
ncbi:MAG: cycloartenol synthase [Opitutaceae bacterium]|nr:cycloartenol synthase [Verrucomicrobiales bacterium]